MNATFTPYLDHDGRPLLRSSITGFVDVLGFSHFATTASDLTEAQRLLDKVASAIRDSREFTRNTFGNHPLAVPGRWAIKFFSDNLVFGIPTDFEAFSAADAAWFAIRCAQCYQLRMMLNGFFVRGALTVGPVCLTDEIIFGASLVECYRLETHESIVPRVILTHPLNELLSRSARSNSAWIPRDATDWICRDVDGWWFVNYLQAARSEVGIDWECINQHKTNILASLAKTTNHDVLAKFGWACRYHNVFCHWNRNDPGYSEQYRINRMDEESTIHRLGDVALADSQ